MRIIQLAISLCSVLFSGALLASPVSDSELADRALAIIGARVPHSTQKCAGCHNLDAETLRSWMTVSATVLKTCLPSGNEAALACLSQNNSSPYSWSPKKLGLWTGRVNSNDFTALFETSAELNRFRQKTFMPRSGGPGFDDQEWLVLVEYIVRGAPLLEEKLSVKSQDVVHPAAVQDVVLLSDLQSPWAVVPSPDGDIWITEQEGRLKIFDSQYRLQKTLENLPDLEPAGQGGLLDLAFHPQYSTNGWIYLAYTVAKNGGYNTEINRFTYRNGRLSERKIILDGPSGTDSAHFGCRLVFDDRGFLYASFGERHQKEKAQSLTSLHGKTVRVTDEGATPRDNPFPNSPIYTLGHRNPQGLAIHPLSKNLIVSEHGPTGYDAPGGGDEINILKAGGNYGWPLVHHREVREGFESPLQEYTPSIAPSGIAFYTGSLIPQWKNDLFVTALRGSALYRLTIDANGRLTGEEKLLDDKYGRLRDVANAPDGTLLVVSDNGELIQLKPR